jgi:Flp pilus assembly protein TadG
MLFRQTKLSKRHIDKQHGATMVEASITFGVFIILLLVGFEFVLATYKLMGLRDAVAVGARRGMIEGSTIQEVKQRIIDTASSYSISIAINDIKICNMSKPDPETYCDSQDDLGKPGDLISYRAEIPYPGIAQHAFIAFTGDIPVLKVKTLARNE